MIISYQQLINAYLKARKGKSNQHSFIKFDRERKSNLRILYNELLNDTYCISKPSRFIVIDPVPREIIALSFRDKIVQHLIFDILYPLRDQTWIYDSYANRKGKGTLFGIKRVDYFIRSCSQNYQQCCRIMKCDIQSFFYSIPKQSLFDSIMASLGSYIRKYINIDRLGLLKLIRHIVFFDYTNYYDCTYPLYKNLIPSHKILGYRGLNYGLPLGNLTSQLFANHYMNALDQYIKHILQIRYYGRYVDDFVMIHASKPYLMDCKQKIQDFLTSCLGLTLHPSKYYLQHYKKGVLFLGIKIFPYYRLPGRRILSGYTRSLKEYNSQSVASYQGLLQHHHTRRIRNMYAL